MSMQLGSIVIGLDFHFLAEHCAFNLVGYEFLENVTAQLVYSLRPLLCQENCKFLCFWLHVEVSRGRQPCLFQYTRPHKNAVKKNCFVLLLLHLANQNDHDRMFCYCWRVGYCVTIVLVYFLLYAVLQKVFCTKICTEVTKPVEIHCRHFNLGLSQIDFHNFSHLKKSS